MLASLLVTAQIRFGQDVTLQDLLRHQTRARRANIALEDMEAHILEQLKCEREHMQTADKTKQLEMRAREVFPDVDATFLRKRIAAIRAHMGTWNCLEAVLQDLASGYEHFTVDARIQYVEERAALRDYETVPYFAASKDERAWQKTFLTALFRHIAVADVFSALQHAEFSLSRAWLSLANPAADVHILAVPRCAEALPAVHASFAEEVKWFRARQCSSSTDAAPPACTTCIVCFEDVHEGHSVRCSARPSHALCSICARGYILTELQSNGRAVRKCPQIECAGVFTDADLWRVLAPKERVEFNKIEARAALAQVASLTELLTCAVCGFVALNDRGAVRMVCACCGFVQCALCGAEEHSPMRCDEASVGAARKRVEEAMTSALVRRCSCGQVFLKADGCNKMKCTCGKFMCNVCRKHIQDYSHFCTCAEKTCTKCHLWENTDRSDNARVEAAKTALLGT